MNKKRILIICGIIILVILAIILVINIRGFIPKGEKSEYKLVIKTTYDGHGVAGQNLGHGSYIETFYVKPDDAFAESIFEAIHLYDIDNADDFDSVILYINGFEEDYVDVTMKNGHEELQYNKEYELKSAVYTADGINKKYTIKFIKK